MKKFYVTVFKIYRYSICKNKYYIIQVNQVLESVKEEIAQMHKERERYEEMMKKAFMRGVCALNLEAMTIFHNNEEKENRDTGNKLPSNLTNKSQCFFNFFFLNGKWGFHSSTKTLPCVFVCLFVVLHQFQ